MKIEFEDRDIDLIVNRLIDRLKPMLPKRQETLQDNNTILNVKELCEYLKVSKRWIYERTRFHEIPYFRISKQEIRFNKKDIDKWIEAVQELVFNNYSGNSKTLKRR